MLIFYSVKNIKHIVILYKHKFMTPSLFPINIFRVFNDKSI